MNEFVLIVIALSCGVLAALFFFGGLWWTVRRVVGLGNPVMLLVSFIVRFAAVGSVFFLFRHDAKLFVPLLIGFIAARAFLIRKICRAAQPQVPHENHS